MAVTHLQPEPSHEIYAVLNRVIEQHYPQIHRLIPQLNIGVLLVRSDQEGKPALKHQGYPETALIHVVSPVDRAVGGPDVVIRYDAAEWDDQDDDERAAILDHELQHLCIKSNSNGEGGEVADQDEFDRPVVRRRNHDFQIGGFYRIIERHRDAAPEKRALDIVREQLRQMSLPFDRQESSDSRDGIALSIRKAVRSATGT
jgi:hypothetical protein